MNNLNMAGVEELRSFPRVAVDLHVSCERNGKVDSCEVVDISPQGIGLRINSLLVPGDKVNIIIGEQTLPATVVRSNGNLVGLWFRELTNSQSGYINWLCRKTGNEKYGLSDKEKVNNGMKVFVLYAETEKEKGLLGMFLTSLKKNCDGFIEYSPMQNGSYQVKIYDSDSSISSFESLVKFWKADNLVIK
jgi:hypothetical protein